MLVRLPVLDLLAARRKPDQDAVNPDPDTIATRIHALIEGLSGRQMYTYPNCPHFIKKSVAC
jgi:hypothetical protein